MKQIAFKRTLNKIPTKYRCYPTGKVRVSCEYRSWCPHAAISHKTLLKQQHSKSRTLKEWEQVADSTSTFRLQFNWQYKTELFKALPLCHEFTIKKQSYNIASDHNSMQKNIMNCLFAPLFWKVRVWAVHHSSTKTPSLFSLMSRRLPTHLC